MIRILHGDCRDVLRTLPADSVQCCVTSPPYWAQRNYGIPPTIWGSDAACEHDWGAALRLHRGGAVGSTRGLAEFARGANTARNSVKDINAGCFCTRCDAWLGSLGLEPDHRLYVEHMVEVFREVRRVLRPDGTLWLNLGDTFVGGGRGGNTSAITGQGKDASQAVPSPLGTLKPKDMAGMPWRVALALQDDGWWLRRDVIWHKRACMPESVDDRPTTAHEYVFLLTKSPEYFYDFLPIMELSSPDSHARAARGRSDKHKYVDGGPGDQTIASGKAVAGRFVAAGVNPKAAEAELDAIRPKQNASFAAAVTELVAMRNARSVWEVAIEPFSGSHFATMPPALAERCLLAGMSEAGACPHCGAPWARVVEKGDADREHQRACGGDAGGDYAGQSIKGHDAAGVQNASDVKRRILAGLRERVTVAWRMTCDCPLARPVRCTVLDPFGGAATTGLAADRLGHDAVLVELNPEYIAMAEKRLHRDGGLFMQAAVA